MRTQSALTWLSIIVLWLLHSYVLANSPVILPKDSFDYSISPYISIYEDEDRQLNIDDIISTKHQSFFSPSHAQSLRLGVSNSNFWFRFSVSNPYDEPIESIFTISDSDFDLINFYQITSDGRYQEIPSDHASRSITGGMMQFFTLQIKSPPKTTTTYLIQLHSIGLLTTHVSLMTLDHFIKNEQHYFLVLGCAFGLLAMAVFGFFHVWRRFNLPIARFGVLYCLVTICYMAANLGVLRIFAGFSHFNADKLAEFCLAMLYLLHIATASSLSWRGIYKKHIRIALRLIALQAVPSAILIIAFFSEAAMPFIALMLVLSTSLTTLIVGFATSTTPTSQRWLLVGYLYSAIGVSVLLLTTYNLLAFNTFSAWGEISIPLGIGFSIILATFYQIPSYKAAQNPRPLDGLEGEILAQVGQEMLTPINSLVGGNHLLSDTPLSMQQRELNQNIQQSATELEYLIQQLSNLGLLQENQLTLAEEPIVFEALLHRVLKDLHGLISNKQLEVFLDIDSELAGTFNADPNRLRIVLFNLLKLVIIHSEHGELTINARGYREGELAGVRLHMQIRNLADRPEIIRHNFSILQYQYPLQSPPAKHLWHLILVRFLLKKLAATLEVESMTTNGASITLSIPLSRCEQTENTHQPQLAHLSGKQVLVVDDNSSLRAMLETQLKRWGMKTNSTHNDKEALALMRIQSNLGEPYHYLVIGHDAPILDGLKLAERIRNDINIGLKPNIILLNHLNNVDIKNDAAELEIQAVLTKPINTEQLLQALNEQESTDTSS